MPERHPRRKIGLFGGSFNPPHVCHTLATLWVLQTHPVDEIWWIPTFQHAFSKDLVPFEHRFRMCEVATRDLDRVHICDVEQRIGGESRTIDTVRKLRADNPDCDFSLIVGTDILRETDRWKDWDGLMKLVDLIVVGRTGYQADISEQFRLPELSSTMIRDALTQRRFAPIEAWVPRDVLAYITEHRLYLAPDDKLSEDAAN